nr:unnamed protein product [Digitaria exilis]
MAALSISTPTSSSLLPPSRQVGRWTPLARSAKPVSFSLRSSPLAARAAAGNAPTSPVDEVVTELDAVASFSEIVPDTVVFDDFEKFAPTAATVSSSLLLGIAGLPNTKFKSAIDTALADGECNALEKHEDRMSCYLTKALANVGAELAHQVPGRVSTEIDARLAYDTQGIIQRKPRHQLLQVAQLLLFFLLATYARFRRGDPSPLGIGGGRLRRWYGEAAEHHQPPVVGKTTGGPRLEGGGQREGCGKLSLLTVHELINLYSQHDVSTDRLLFKIPATWQGIEASRLLETDGIQTHLTFVYSFAQAAAAAQAGASVVQIFVGRLRDWARNHSGDPEIDEALKKGEDAGLALAQKVYAYIHRNGYKTKLMAAAIRNKQDVFSLLGIDYIIAPLKVLQSLDESVTDPDVKYSYVPRLTPAIGKTYDFTEEELVKWDQLSLAAAMGPAAEELLASGLEGYANQTRRVEELFEKIWPPPNV